MVQINFAQKTVNVKIVYYGPGMSGKTTNLEVVHQRAPEVNRGELTSISTDGDRTLFFDYMPLELGTVAGMRTCFQLYTVPGQVYYNSTRKLVLQGVDGVIFIADSSPSMLDQNLESLRNLEENLNEYGKSLATLPHVIQWNKRDLPDAMAPEELERHLNHHSAPTFEGVANSGQGVFPTLKALAASVLKGIMKETAGGKSGSASAPAAPAPTAAASAPVAPSAPMAPQFPTPQAAPQPSAPAPAAQQQVAQQQVAAPAAQAQGTSPSGLMQQQPQPQRASRSATATRPAHGRSRQATGTAARRARQSVPAPTPTRSASKKSSTGLFVLAAAGIGAAIAWAAMNYAA